MAKSPKAAARRSQSKACDCVTQVNEQLAEHNTQIAVAITLKTSPNQIGSLPLVATTKLEDHKRGRPKTVVCSYCPFCGKKLPEA